MHIHNCQQAIAHGIAMVPEDRKKDGIVPVMAVGKNITLAALDKFTGGMSHLDDAAEQKCILESLQQLKVKYEIYKLINQLVQEGIAVIVISSELPEVLGLSDRILVMHEGKLKANLVNHNLTQEQVMEAALRSEHHVEKQSV